LALTSSCSSARRWQGWVTDLLSPPPACRNAAGGESANKGRGAVLSRAPTLAEVRPECATVTPSVKTAGARVSILRPGVSIRCRRSGRFKELIHLWRCRRFPSLAQRPTHVFLVPHPCFPCLRKPSVGCLILAAAFIFAAKGITCRRRATRRQHPVPARFPQPSESKRKIPRFTLPKISIASATLQLW